MGLPSARIFCSYTSTGRAGVRVSLRPWMMSTGALTFSDEGQLKSPISFTRFSAFSPTLQDQRGCGIVKRMATQTLTVKVPFLRLNAAKAAEFARLQDLNVGHNGKSERRA